MTSDETIRELREVVTTLDTERATVLRHRAHFENGRDKRRTAWLAHPDGSWARASAMSDELPLVRQGGPRRLWDIADDIRHAWLIDGGLPAYGAAVTISPDGGIRLDKGRWHAEIPAAD